MGTEDEEADSLIPSERGEEIGLAEEEVPSRDRDRLVVSRIGHSLIKHKDIQAKATKEVRADSGGEKTPTRTGRAQAHPQFWNQLWLAALLKRSKF